MHASIIGERVGSGGKRNRLLCSPDARHHIITHCQSLLGEKGCVILSVSPPTPALVPGSFWGGPTSVPMVWGILECLGNQGRLGLHTGGGMETRGCTQTLGYTRAGEGLGGWEQGLGGQLGS